VIAALTGADLDLDPPMAGMINAQMSQQAVQCGPLLVAQGFEQVVLDQVELVVRMGQFVRAGQRKLDDVIESCLSILTRSWRAPGTGPVPPACVCRTRRDCNCAGKRPEDRRIPTVGKRGLAQTHNLGGCPARW
jgi:hypothetical protein